MANKLIIRLQYIHLEIGPSLVLGEKLNLSALYIQKLTLNYVVNLGVLLEFFLLFWALRLRLETTSSWVWSCANMLYYNFYWNLPNKLYHNRWWGAANNNVINGVCIWSAVNDNVIKDACIRSWDKCCIASHRKTKKSYKERVKQNSF